MQKALGFLFLLLALVGFQPAQADGPQSDWRRNDFGAVRLIAAQTALGDSGEILLGLEFQPKPGWKLYWRSPGDAGYPPKMDWTGSENLAGASIEWPAPHRFSAAGFETVGYEGRLILPIRARVADPSRALFLKASVDYLTCDALCAPIAAHFEMILPPGDGLPSLHATGIGRFLDRVPKSAEDAGVTISLGEEKGGILRVTAESATAFRDPDLFVEGAGFAAPEISYGAGKRMAVFRLAPHDAPKDGVSGVPLTLTLVDRDLAVERQGFATPVAPMEIKAPDENAAGSISGLIAMLGVALLGGLILNVMPCVLPVLSLKIFGVLQKAEAEKSRIRGDFLASALGIVFSFLGLAAALIGLKAAGGWIGWGIQFQQPLFLAVMCAALTLFAANLWGFFSFSLPSFLGALAGGAAAERRAGHFMEGVLATLLATPCSAPMVGTALGFAMAGDFVDILAIFAALGIGMSLPYLAFAAAPGLMRFLPNPGRWMLWVKGALGFALIGTALWLLYVLFKNQGLWAALLVGGACLSSLAMLAFGARLPASLRKGGAAALFLGVFLVVGLAENVNPATKGEETDGLVWRPFAPETAAALTAEGKTVLIDITADWCLTCKLNEQTTFGAEKVKAALDASDIVLLRGDWTRPDPVLARFMADRGRYALPFNMIFGPAAPNGVLLPELLLPDDLLNALEQARGTGEGERE